MGLISGISPYPGLRPFTEAEAIFFKGREHHVAKIQNELLAHRFLMVTGASGDGKSSLIFAGLLPRIRAGFVRGEHMRWKVSIFRPGHRPMQNLCNALSNSFPNKLSEDLEKQLKFGYSALVGEYNNSSLSLDENSDKFQALDQSQQKKARRKASNLLIVVDQFEEFFTSDENFDKETAIPSTEAQLVMNLLIETSRLSKEQNVPIYIVCTMRSDYIGNAPSYRGLPELIGDQQFFVPRLNRVDIQKVIEEPAKLNNNKISKRLIQRLINDLDVVNTDVLPSLQHTLRRIWEEADQGKLEMDLIHYAKVGGMPQEDLPLEDQAHFKAWQNLLPLYHKNLFTTSSGVSNVINMHADILYETAHEQAGVSLDREKSQEAIKSLFKCLTQIDDSKAVRNRVTLGMAHKIINKRELSIGELIAVLTSFRQQGNTLVYPFITEKNEVLNSETLLDITHESLIRNWQKLKKWTLEEHEDVQDFKELTVQLKRWTDNNKSKEHLLSTGVFHYMESKLKGSLPTAPWIRRYMDYEILEITDGRSTVKLIDKEDSSEEELIAESQHIKNNIVEFYQKSKEQVDAKRRQRKLIFATISMLALIAAAGFFWALVKKEEAINLNKEISRLSKANLIATNAYTMLDKDPTLALRLAEKSYQIEPTPLNKQVLMAAYSKYPNYESVVHGTTSLAIKVANNGKFFVSFGNTTELKIWSSSGLLIRNLKGHTVINQSHSYALLDLSDNDSLIVSAGQDSTARIWSANGKSLHVLKHDNSVDKVEFLSDNKSVQTVAGNTITVWQNGKVRYRYESEYYIKDGSYLEELNRFLIVSYEKLLFYDTLGTLVKRYDADDGYIWDAKYSHRYKKICVSNQKSVKIFDSDLNLLKNYNDLSTDVYALFLDSTGRYLSNSSFGHNAEVWDLKKDTLIHFKGHTGNIWMAQVHPETQKLITCGDDGTARIWSLDGTHELTLKGHTSVVYDAAFSRDGKMAFTAGSDGTCRIWDLEPDELPNLLKFESGVENMNESVSGKLMAFADRAPGLSLWKRSGKHIHTWKDFEYYIVDQCGFLSNDSVIFGSTKTELKMYQTHKPYGLIRQFKHRFINVNWLKQNRLVVQHNDTMQIMNLDEKVLLEMNNINTFWIYENSNTFITLDYSDKLCVYDYLNNVAILKDSLVFSEEGTYFSIIADEKNKYIRMSTHDPKIRLYKLDGGIKELFQIDGRPEKVSNNVQNGLIAFCFEDNDIYVYNLTGKLEFRLKGHTEAVSSMEFSIDSRYLVSGSRDDQVIVWDLNDGSHTIIPIHTSPVNEVKVSNDSKYVYSVSQDGTGAIYPINVNLLLDKINNENIRSTVYELTEKDVELYQIVDDQKPSD